MKLALFRQMFELNRSFDEVAEGLKRLGSVTFFQRELIHHALSDVEIARVYANREFFDNFEKDCRGRREMGLSIPTEIQPRAKRPRRHLP